MEVFRKIVNLPPVFFKTVKNFRKAFFPPLSYLPIMGQSWLLQLIATPQFRVLARHCTHPHTLGHPHDYFFERILFQQF
jgi:hypothetical protein